MKIKKGKKCMKQELNNLTDESCTDSSGLNSVEFHKFDKHNLLSADAERSNLDAKTETSNIRDDDKNTISAPEKKSENCKIKIYPKIYILACGLLNLYILELENTEIKLVKKLDIRVTSLTIVNKGFICLTDKQILYGFRSLNKIEALEKHNMLINIRSADGKKNQKDLISKETESSINNVEHKQIKFLPQKNTFQLEKPIKNMENWHTFVIIKNEIVPVLLNKGKYIIKVQNKKYSYGIEVCHPVYSHHLDSVIFFLKSRDSKVVLLKDQEVSLPIDKITSISVCRYITVATGDGFVYLLKYDDKKKRMIVSSKNKCYNLSLTSVALLNDFLYFTSFNGLIDRKKICLGRMFKLFVLLSLIVAVLSYFMYFK
ncbi:hypothetical protein EDEG_01874 [Edhazardia aedis USNM 41457]|uniref:Uncharacterized protein n=1 Tax=Edhazardia aedis (strain USNM 41457) TaxID=1003232 RepID=J9DMK6_EDHAE|nr:hypothetical protein EDEG_01874 [Edhazardia aedis USNM 41457]|eukprot:EJW03830.1 hypothetical protein EDEG_01874 [Edhazardia aedis USNM 41457]